MGGANASRGLNEAGRVSGSQKTVSISKGDTLTLADPARFSVHSVDFAPGGSGTLKFGDAKSFGGTIAGFNSGDTIDLLKMIARGRSFTGGALTPGTASGAIGLTFAGSYTTANFAVGSDGKGGTDICFVTPPAAAMADLVRGALPVANPLPEALARGAGSYHADPLPSHLPVPDFGHR